MYKNNHYQSPLICKVVLLVAMLCLPLLMAAQTVTGIVTDAGNGEPLTGVSVKAQKAGTAAVTDIDGRYSIKVAESDRLEFTYIGFDPYTVIVGAKRNINVRMSSGSKSLDDVVVIGYGTQRKADLTGAVSVVDMSNAKKLATSSIAELLEGQVAGVSVQSNGDPGSIPSIRIRGIGSFSASAPLYVVDGLIVNDVNHLNPNDIESMNVLKDASATAIYGSRGANGVILITTKKGRAGRTDITASANFGVQSIGKKIKMKNALDFLTINEQSYLNARKAWPATLYGLVPGMKVPDTDWQDAIFQTGITQDYNVSYAQGTDKTSLMVGAGYYKQKGVLIGPKYDRFTFRVNSEGRKGILRVGENLTLSVTDQKYTNSGQSSFTNALYTPPVIPVRDPNEPSGRGGYGYGSNAFPTYAYNAVANQERYDNRQVNYRVLGNMFLELQPIKPLTYKLNLGVDFWHGRMKYFDKGYTLRIASAETKFQNVLDDTRDERLSLLMEHTLTWKQSFGHHNFEAMGGFTVEDVKWYYLKAEGYDQKVPGLEQIDLVGKQNNMWGSHQEQRLISYLFRLNYNYADRYLFQFNLRSDGSSKFGPAKRRGTFPSASLGWRIDKESFFEPLQDYVSQLKLRTSYGVIGDMSALGNYDYIPDIDHSGPYEGFYAVFGPEGSETLNQGATQSGAVNPNLGWEKKATFNIGLDFTLLNDRLFGSFEWYNSISSDLLVNLPQAWATGVDSKWTNYGKMRNRGVDLTLGWKDKKGDFSYGVTANVSTVRNKVLRLGESFREAGWGNVNRTEVGRSIGDFYVIHTDGIFQSMDEVFDHTTVVDGKVKVIQPNAQPGDIRFVDANHDGQINDDDRQWSGSPLPKFEAGLNINLGWRDFDFTMFWSGRFGNKIFNAQRVSLMNFNVDNIPADVYPWTWDNPTNEAPRMYAGSTNNNKANIDSFLENGSFFRLKNLQLGYTLPSAVAKVIGITSARVYVQGQNLLTFTEYKGYDPEISGGVLDQGNDWGSFPPVRSFNVGLQVTF